MKIASNVDSIVSKKNSIKKRRKIKASSRGRVEQVIRHRPKPKLFLPKNEFNEKMDRMKRSSSNRLKN